MQTHELAVISIHPDQARPLDLDLRHILSALGKRSENWVWCVRDLDWLGEDGETLYRAVEAAGPTGFWLGSQELEQRAQSIYQTIEGSFLAFPKSLDRRSLDITDLDLASFPASQAEFAIVAVDGCYFDIYSKDALATQDLLGRFPNVHSEPTDRYF
jgi:hypothetical protein